MNQRFIPVGPSIVFLRVMRLQAQPCSATWASGSSSLRPLDRGEGEILVLLSLQ